MQQKEFKTILFDMDGVVIDSEKLHLKAMGLTLEQHDIPYSHPFLTEYVGRSDESFFTYVFDNIDSSFEVEKLLDIKNTLFEGLLAELEYVEGFIEFINKVDKNVHQIGLVTSSSLFTVNKVNELLNLKQYFEVIITEEDTQKHKPFPDPYLLALLKFEADKSKTLIIEDSINGIKSGKTAGCTVAGMTTSFNADVLRNAGADFVVNSYSDLELLLNI